jgi:hypothetical protein
MSCAGHLPEAHERLENQRQKQENMITQTGKPVSDVDFQGVRALQVTVVKLEAECCRLMRYYL